MGVRVDLVALIELAKLPYTLSRVSPMGAVDVLHSIDRIANAPPELLEYVRKLLAETKGGGWFNLDASAHFDPSP